MSNPNRHVRRKRDIGKFTAAVLKLLERYKDCFPEKYALLKNQVNPKTEDLLSCLILFFAEDEQDSSANSSCFISNPPQERMRDFAVQIALLLIAHHNRLMEYTEYMTLLSQKYIAYGFLSRWNQDSGLRHSLQNNPQIHVLLYHGLLNFYANFYGRSSDHEEAIRLLCSCCPPDAPLKMDINQIASVLYLHVSTAGTPNDPGYAYRGISSIEQSIAYLPVEIVMALLPQYSLYEVIHNHVFRHQIFSVIEFSSIEKSQKAQIKFQYLDAVLLMDCLTKPLLVNFKKWHQNLNICYPEPDLTLGAPEIAISRKPYAYWNCTDHRLFLDNMEIIRFIKQSDPCIRFIYKTERHRTLPFVYTDWQLESYFSRETEQFIQELINDEPPAFTYKQMLFSLLHLEHYRGISRKTIHFDHRFLYDQSSCTFHKNTACTYPGSHFYGKSVYSLSCIVGKNGTGKTSIVDFLRESFFKLLKLLDDGLIICDNGRITEADCKAYHILDESTRFTVIFYLGETSYFITNMKADIRDARPFLTSTFRSVNECSKIAYFSNMLRMDQADLFFDEKQTANTAGFSQSLSRFKQADYSETACFIRKRKSIEMYRSDTALRIPNRELCYQFTFLRYMKSADMEKCLDIKRTSHFYVKSPLGQAQGNDFTLEDLEERRNRKMSHLEKKYIFFPDAQIYYLSSGQYSKFSFLSRLYWFFNGYETEIKRYHQIFDTNEFRSEEALLCDETALIFIDEGELYYHPEWQRRYIQTLLEIANSRKDHARVQIILTTNSPFLISDILKEDIVYLENDQREPLFDYTLGQNIHTLLKENFFMDYTIGEYSRRLINLILNALNQKKPRNEDDLEELKTTYLGDPEDVYSALNTLIGQIGEPVYRYNLERLLEKSPLMDTQRQAAKLKTQIMQLTKKMEMLEKKGKN